MNDIQLTKANFGYKISRRDRALFSKNTIPVGAIIWYQKHILIAGVLRHIDIKTILDNWKYIIHPEIAKRPITVRYFPSYYDSVGYSKKIKRIYKAFVSLDEAKRQYSVYSNSINNGFIYSRKPALYVK